jgi:hypothetical protein
MRSRQLRPGRYSPFASSTERSLVERFAVLVPSALLRATTALPFVISTEAQRSGEICGPRSLCSTPGHDDPPRCHLDRSAAKWRDLRSSFPLLCSGPRRPSPLSSRPKRSEVERSAVQRFCLGNVFRQSRSFSFNAACPQSKWRRVGLLSGENRRSLHYASLRSR